MSLFESGDFIAPVEQPAEKFGELGSLLGMTKDEIVAAAGPPDSMYAMNSHELLLQWLRARYHIALVFKEDTCVGMTTHESFPSRNR